LISLMDILTVQRIKVPMVAQTKAGVIEELVDLLAGCGELPDRQAALAAVLEREQTRTTGIGGGLAIPHGKYPGPGRLVMAVGKPAQPVPFDSIDDRPVWLVILLVGPAERIGEHIQALARISRLASLDEFRKALSRAGTAEEVFEVFRRGEHPPLP